VWCHPRLRVRCSAAERSKAGRSRLSVKDEAGAPYFFGFARCGSLAAPCADRTVTPAGSMDLPSLAPGTDFETGAFDALSAVVMALALNAMASEQDKASFSHTGFMSISLL